MVWARNVSLDRTEFVKTEMYCQKLSALLSVIHMYADIHLGIIISSIILVNM